MKARNAVIPLALFALAFVGSLFAMRRGTPLADGPAAATAVRIAAAPPSTSGRDAATASGLPALAAGTGAASSATAANPAAAHAVATAPGRPAVFSAPPVAEAPAPAEPPPEDVSLPTVRESYALLKNVGTREERVRAIQAISEAAQRGSELVRARQALRLAASDPDPEVAARAQEEYEHIAEHDER